jgi:integrase
MPRLSDTKIRGSKPRAKPFKLYDIDGLFLIVNPNGSKWWRQRYRYAGREQLLSLGVYDAITLAEARERSAEIRKLVTRGVDPSAHRKAQTAALVDAKANTLKAVAQAWHAKFKPQWSEHHAHRVLQRLEDNVFPWLGAKAIRDVTSADILACVDRMAQRGAYDTARRVLQIVKKIFKWAIGRGLIATSPAAHIEPREQLPSIDVRHRAAITDPAQLGALMRAIDGYQGGFVVKCGLKLIALTFVRPGELRRAEWPEFSLDGKEPTWRIPAARMKMGGEDHIVPLSEQAVAVLRELQPLTGADGKGYLFPSIRNASRPISENTLNIALRAMGFTQQQHCSHGFRGTASTMLNEQQWNKDAIELQLAHMPRDKVRASYNGAAHLPLRRKMMQGWADYLDGLKAGAKAVPLRQRTP